MGFLFEVKYDHYIIFPLVGIIGLVSIAISKIKCTELAYAEVISVSTTYHDEYDVPIAALFVK